MTSEPVFKLEMLLDPVGIPLDQLKQECDKLLSDQRNDITLELFEPDSGKVILRIVGPLQIVDICHDKLNDGIIERPHRPCIRLTDEAGEHIRMQAYPVLARIEHEFRTFVNRALVEVFGFDWWERLAPVRLQEKIVRTRRADPEYASILHPLEYTQFDDLLSLIEEEVSEWPESRLVSVSDLTEILSGCATVNEAINRIKQKTKKISYWDSVFARYFENKDTWDRLKSSLNYVIQQRHRVMHHRPMRFAALAALASNEESIGTLIRSAKAKLSEKERAEAQAELTQKLAEIVRDLNALEETLGKSQQGWSRLVAALATPEFREAMDRYQQESLRPLVAALAMPEFHEAMERFRQDTLSRLASAFAASAEVTEGTERQGREAQKQEAAASTGLTQNEPDPEEKANRPRRRRRSRSDSGK